MIINVDMFVCDDCKLYYKLDTSKQHTYKCTKCGKTLTFSSNYDAYAEKIPPEEKECAPGEPQPKPAEPFNPYRNKVTCKYCGSYLVKEISSVSRLFSVGLFGLASSKVGKQWHCNSCGSDF